MIKSRLLVSLMLVEREYLDPNAYLSNELAAYPASHNDQ